MRLHSMNLEEVAFSSAKRTLGSYYSPDEYARALVRWALNGSPGTVLDPSYGGCAFLRVALEALGELGSSAPTEMIFGSDVDGATAKWTRQLVLRGVPESNLLASDFLSLAPDVDIPRVAAVVGNPPYVRHHWLTSDALAAAATAMADAGVSLSKRASYWAYFVVHATRFVEPGGRLALLLPGSILNADYAPDVLSYLERSFGEVRLIRVRERIFVEAQEETVALFASDAGAKASPGSTRFADVDGLQEMLQVLAKAGGAQPRPDSDGLEGIAAWKLATVPDECLAMLQSVLRSPQVTQLRSLATVGLGTVTGANAVFVISEADEDRLGVQGLTIPVVGRSAWLPGPVLTRQVLAGSQRDRRNRMLVLPNDFSLDRRTKLGIYLSEAERAGVNERHHCSREPWWALRSVRVPDAFLPYTVSSPRGLTLNLARAGSTNTVHQMTWRLESTTVEEKRSCVLSTWSTLGRLAAELYGRHYGGGVLKLELAAAQRLPILTNLAIDDETWSSCAADRRLSADAADSALLRADIGLRAIDLALMSAVADRLATERVGRRSMHSGLV